VSETQFLHSVTELLDCHKWTWVHFLPSQVRHGKWVTHGTGRVKGFPDLLCLRGKRAMVLELKVDGNRATVEQSAYLEDFGKAGIEAHLVSPETWEFLERIVR
jgi:hypothetical protein